MKNHMMIVVDVIVCSIIIILLYQITFINSFIITKTRTQHNNYNLQQQQQQFITGTNSRYYYHHIVHTTYSSPIIRSQHYMKTTTTTSNRRSSNHVLYSSSSNNNNNKKDNKVDMTTVDKDETSSTSTSMMSNNNNIDNLDPDPSILLSSYNNTIQQIGFISIIILLTFGTYAFINILSFFEHSILPYEWSTIWNEYILSIPLSILFLFGGITHFILKETYIPMIPPKDTWGGLWPNLPTPYIDRIPIKVSYEEYHVYWTGIAEISGGFLLLLAATTHILPMYIPSFLLFILLICITPANIYMATHNIQVPKLPPIPYPYGHINRGIIQCILFAILYQLTFT